MNDLEDPDLFPEDYDEVPGGDPILKDFDTVYQMCKELSYTLVEQADLRIDRPHHRPAIRDTLNDLDLVDKFVELFKDMMDPRDNPDDPQA